MGRVGRAIAYLSLLSFGPALAGCAAKPVSVDPPKGVQNLSRIATAYIDAEGRLGRPGQGPARLIAIPAPGAGTGTCKAVKTRVKWL